MSQVMLPRSARAIPRTQTERDASEHGAEQPLPAAVNPQDPPDETGAEMAKDARVWKTYVRETDRWDKEMVEGRNNLCKSRSQICDAATLSPPCRKAALFSAISTAFVIESLGDLKPDPAESSAQTLLLMSQTLISISNGQSVKSLGSGTTETPPFVPSRTAVVVNLLWFLSLSLSVAVSLIAMLAKEWCYKFMSGRSGSMYEQARRRQQRWNGIEKWKMKEVLTYLPGLMHLALLLFAIGLTVYLWDINVRVAVPVAAVTALALLAYVSTTVLPLLDSHCPYATPVTALLLDIVHIRAIAYSFFHRLYLKTDEPEWLESVLEFLSDLLETNVHESKGLVIEREVPMDTVTSQMLSWMIVTCEDSRSVEIALQALASSNWDLPHGPLQTTAAADAVSERIQAHVQQWLRIPEPSRSSNASMFALTVMCSRLYSILVTGGVYSDSWDRWHGYRPIESRSYMAYHGWEMIEVNEFITGCIKSTDDNLNEVALALSATMPYLHFSPNDHRVNPLLHKIKHLAPGVLTSVLSRHMGSNTRILSSHVLQLLVESSVHYLIGLYPREEIADCQALLPVLLARIFVTSDGASTRLRQTIAVALATAAFATYTYPGGDQLSNGDDSREKRAVQVLHHYRANPPNDDHISLLLSFGFVGLLPRIDTVELAQHTDLTQKVLARVGQYSELGSIYNLPRSFKFREHGAQVLAKFLFAVPKTLATAEAEGNMVSSCLKPAVNFLFLRDTSSRSLYIPALVAICHAQSSELQDLCMRILDVQEPPTYSDDLSAAINEHKLFKLLYQLSISNNQRLAPTIALHFTMLAAVFALSPEVSNDARQAAFASLMQHSDFRERTPSYQDRRLPTLNDFRPISEDARQRNFASGVDTRLMQLIANFYHADANQTSSLGVGVLDTSVPNLREMLEEMKDHFESSFWNVDLPQNMDASTLANPCWPQKHAAMDARAEALSSQEM